MKKSKTCKEHQPTLAISSLEQSQYKILEDKRTLFKSSNFDLPKGNKCYKKGTFVMSFESNSKHKKENMPCE